MSETPESIIARALNQMGGRAGFCNELAGAIIASLEAAGFVIVGPNAIQIPRSRQEAAAMLTVADGFLNGPPPPPRVTT